MTAAALIRRMAKRYAAHRGKTALSLVSTVVTVVLTIVNPLLLTRIIDHALPEGDTQALLRLCGLMMFIGLLTSALSVGGGLLADWTGQRVMAGLREDVYDRARAQPLGFYDEAGQSQIQARLVSDLQGVDRFLSQSARSALDE